ncbi:helix-turn-helix domain-containing protein [Rhizobium sp. L51/94]|uniref:helix-turn-helix domain-containing protein n=1 Tax=Rhizobium sp. L51/94 TaxID=2819999 RepID=UPI001C5B88ED|nr:helix-turn-helix transcriptional regulator [Rhizobium sp. L51/94]QXZ79627.1 helix-turn-helix transcriptional regulator [Rhizobium sp. L51/94]
MKSTLSKRCADMDRAIGEKLRDFRKMAGISQQIMGADIGVTFQQIQKYEKGTNRVSVSALVLICQRLGITPMDVIGPYFGKTDEAEGPVGKALAAGRQATAQLNAIRKILASSALSPEQAMLAGLTAFVIPPESIDDATVTRLAGLTGLSGEIRFLDEQLVTQ